MSRAEEERGVQKEPCAIADPAPQTEALKEYLSSFISYFLPQLTAFGASACQSFESGTRGREGSRVSRSFLRKEGHTAL